MTVLTFQRGKYAGLTLPRLDGEEPDYQAKVNAVKTELLADPDFKRQASFLAREYKLLRAEKDALDAGMYELNIRLKAVSQLMTDQFEAEGVDNIRVDGRPVSVYYEPYAQVTNKEAFRQYCLRDDDLSRRMTLPWQTTNELAKKMLLAGEDVPDGVEVYAATKIRLGSEG
jgi:hypothetical protein